MKTHLIPFHDDQISAFEVDGRLSVAVKPICQRLGIAFEPQLAKLRADRERWGMTIIVTPSNSGMQETACIPKAKLFGWLNSIHPSKVAEKARPALRRYQLECDAVLDAYWTRKLGLPGHLPVAVDVQGDQATLAVREMMQLLLDRMDRLENRLHDSEEQRLALADHVARRTPALRITPADIPIAPFTLKRPRAHMAVKPFNGREKREMISLIRAGFANADIARAMNMSLAYMKKARRVVEAEGRIDVEPALTPLRGQLLADITSRQRPRKTLDPQAQYAMAFAKGAARG